MGLSSPRYIALYAKVFFVVSNIYSASFVLQGAFLKISDIFFILLKSRVVTKSQTYRKEWGVEEGKNPFIYGITYVCFKF